MTSHLWWSWLIALRHAAIAVIMNRRHDAADAAPTSPIAPGLSGCNEAVRLCERCSVAEHRVSTPPTMASSQDSVRRPRSPALWPGCRRHARAAGVRAAFVHHRCHLGTQRPRERLGCLRGPPGRGSGRPRNTAARPISGRSPSHASPSAVSASTRMRQLVPELGFGHGPGPRARRSPQRGGVCELLGPLGCP